MAVHSYRAPVDNRTETLHYCDSLQQTGLAGCMNITKHVAHQCIVNTDIRCNQKLLATHKIEHLPHIDLHMIVPLK